MALPDEDELLVRLIGELADGVGGGGAGARFSARRLKKDVCEIPLTSGLSATEACALAARLLEHVGRAFATDGLPGGGMAVRGAVGVGMGGMNPAVVTVSVSPATVGCAVGIRVVAKEGLIRQRGGRKGARLVADGWAEADPTALPA